MSEDAKGGIANVKDITEKINSGEGMASLLIDDADTAMRFKNIIENVEDTSENTVGATRSIKVDCAQGRRWEGVLWRFAQR